MYLEMCEESNLFGEVPPEVSDVTWHLLFKVMF